MKTLIKQGRAIVGYAWKDRNGQCWCAFGKPSDRECIAFAVPTIEAGVEMIEAGKL